MAVQARRFSHDFPASVGGSLFLDEYAPTSTPAWPRDTTVLRDFPRSDLACNYGFAPRKRPRLAAMEAPAAGFFLDDQRAAVMMDPAGIEGPVAVPSDSSVVDARSREVGSGAASTSGRVVDGASATRGLLAWMHHQGAVEIDALVRLEAERMRAGLEEARRRHARALLAAAGRAASGRLRAAEAEASRALRRNAELEEKARQMGAECQAWAGVATSHEAVAAGLRATLDQLLIQSPRAAEVPAEDAQSCCFEEEPPLPRIAGADEDGAASSFRSEASSCKSCGGGEACVLLLPCRHLCLCRACEPALEACPVCAAAKNGSLHVLFS